ncbi:hypothetical protein [Listeria booriae]|uniref:hypothetical protein n=1 Tax=Listeria booriae TaxID=1552123 RepID=UPI0016255AFF|nr:hypothetical protein [Listeria booriae]MBC1974540.1 hypothetical protein [Listeria booriae]MBC1983472.1 hypothetical protein [Listeria booriae]MBC2031832.1 hypothetical protein [Listeria booriae]
MTQSQNEKDRELLDMCASNRENGWCIDTMGDEGDMLYEIANRLLTERENAEVGYLHDPAKLLNYRDQHATCFFNKQESWNGIRGIKVIWIPVEEA